MPTLPVLAIAALLASGGAARPRSDLVVRAVSASPMSVQAGKSFTASATIANRGRRKARRSQVRFSLAPAAGSELGVVRALRPRKRSASEVTLTVPATVAAGTYRLRACADAGHRIRERSERNNCRTARGRIAVLASPRPGPGTGHPHPGGPTPDPADVAPPVSTTIASSLGDTAAFLYTGADPVQAGVAPGTIKPQRVAVVRGRVTGRDGAPLAGVAVTVLDHPELGHTSTRADGMYDIAVNGGGPLTLAYAKAGRLPAQRTVATPWQDYAYVDDVALVTLDPHVTDVETGARAPVQVVRGSEITDSDGTRQPTLIFDAGTTAQMELPNGTTRRLDDLHVRATEYTVGDAGPEAMPGDLPPTSGYTYAAELSVDEALAAHATDVRFSTPVAVYVENFPGFPVGGAVPAGYYDRERAAWVASRNGRVIKIVGESGGLADVDTDGDGAADDDGIDDAERGRLAGLYDAGQELWRVEVSHFTPWDYNWPYGPPADAIRPNPLEPPDRAAAPPPGRKPDCFNGGSVIGCLSRTLGEGAGIVGTPYALRYSSERAPGRAAARSVVIPLSGPSVPASLKRIDLEVTVAGQRMTRSFAPAPNASFTFVWDGRDAYGRKLQGEQPVTARIGFAYGAVYYPQPASFEASFGRIMRSGDARVIGRDQADIVLWNDWTGHVGGWDDADLGGWSIDVHHSYAPQSGTLYRGDRLQQGRPPCRRRRRVRIDRRRGPGLRGASERPAGRRRRAGREPLRRGTRRARRQRSDPQDRPERGDHDAPRSRPARRAARRGAR
jgi:CARDB protein